MPTLRRWTVVIAGGLVMVGACNKRAADTGAVSSTSDRGTTVAPPSETVARREKALVRVVNALPSGKINVFAGDSEAFSGIGYRTVTPFKQMPDDFFGFKVVRPGGTSKDPIAENREKLGTGGHYTIVAMPDEGKDGKANLRVLDDDLKPMTDGKARIRVIHGVANAPDVSVYERGVKEAIFDGINFKKEAGWQEIDPFTGALDIRPQGKHNLLASVRHMKLQAGRSYTFVIAGTPSKLDVIKIEDIVAPAARQ